MFCTANDFSLYSYLLSSFRFSPDGRYLSVGSQEGTIDFYDMSKGPSLKRASFCKGIAGFVAMIDYSSDGKYIRVSTGAYKNQYFDVPGGKELTDKTAIRSLSFDSWTR